MALPLALPLAPVAAQGATAAAATFLAGSSLALAEAVYGFRRSTPTLPPLTGQEGGATLRELIADALAGARVPVALPPSPLGPNGSPGAMAAMAAAAGVWGGLKGGFAQLWGLLAGQPRTAGALGIDQSGLGEGVAVTGSYSKTGLTNVYVRGSWVGVISQWGNCNPWSSGDPGYPSYDGSYQYANGLLGFVESPGGYSSFCGPPTKRTIYANTPGGVVPMMGLNAPANIGITGWEGTVELTTTGPDPQSAAAISENVWTSPAGFGNVATGPAAMPSLPPLPLIQPAVAPTPGSPNPAEPQTEPEVVPVQPGPSRPAVPAVAPSIPPAIAPWLFPNGLPSTKTRQDGSLAPPVAPPVVTTNPGSTFLPGGIELPSNGPQATPQATAAELGKLEKKLELALAPEGPLSLRERINQAIDQIENIKFVIDALFPPGPYQFGGGQYTLTPVCERDENGQPSPDRIADWEGGEGQIAEVNNKIDALAALIQFHKELKQPTCRGPAPTGEDVTVTFEQIE